MQHLQPRCLEDRFRTQQTRKKVLLNHRHLITSFPTNSSEKQTRLLKGGVRPLRFRVFFLIFYVSLTFCVNDVAQQTFFFSGLAVCVFGFRPVTSPTSPCQRPSAAVTVDGRRLGVRSNWSPPTGKSFRFVHACERARRSVVGGREKWSLRCGSEIKAHVPLDRCFLRLPAGVPSGVPNVRIFRSVVVLIDRGPIFLNLCLNVLPRQQCPQPQVVLRICLTMSCAVH